MGVLRAMRRFWKAWPAYAIEKMQLAVVFRPASAGPRGLLDYEWLGRLRRPKARQRRGEEK
jgi:hypothetical protein